MNNNTPNEQAISSPEADRPEPTGDEQVPEEEPRPILTLSTAMLDNGEVRVAWAFGEGYKLSQDQVETTLIGMARRACMAIEELYSPVRTRQVQDINQKVDAIINLLSLVEGIDQAELTKTVDTLYKQGD